MVTFYKYWNVNPHRLWLREFLAEFCGTFMLIFLGNSAIAQSVFSGGKSGNFVTVYLGYALGIFVGVLVSAGVSGAHLNPAVTVAGAVLKKVDWVKVPHYLVAQYLGGFFAACCTYLLYIDNFSNFHETYGVNITTAGIFATYPDENLSVLGGFIDQIFGTMVLLIGIYAIMDKQNTNIPLQLVPIYVTLLILSIACSMGINEGFALNPARDFAPRLFTCISGWGSQVFAYESFWYIPIVGTHIGGILGAAIYVYAVEKMRPVRDEDTNKDYNIQIIEKKVYHDNGHKNALPTSKPIPSPVLSQSNEVYTCRL